MKNLTLLKVILGFLVFSLLYNLGIPLMANHGHFDLSNAGFYPYLRIGLFLFVEAVLLLILILTKPTPNKVLYRMGKITLPMTTVTLGINTYRNYEEVWSWGVSSTTIFGLQVLVVGISLWMSAVFIMNKKISR